MNLAIQHNIWLNREQRYKIHECVDIATTGVSIPVWVDQDKITSEPAKEIFCNYYLKNPKKELPIKIVKDGYEINIPYEEGTLPEISNDEWRDLNYNHPEKFEYMYKKCKKSVTSENLLDICDGGATCLKFREHNKLKIGNDIVNIIHFVNILDIDELISSII